MVPAAEGAAVGAAAAATPTQQRLADLNGLVREANKTMGELCVQICKAKKGERALLEASPELAKGLRELQRSAAEVATFDPAYDWDRAATKTLVEESDNVIVAVHTDAQKGDLREDMKSFKNDSTVWAYIEALTEAGSYRAVDVQKYRDKKDKQLYTVVSVLRHTRNKNAIRPMLLLNTYHMKACGAPDRLIAHFNHMGVCAGVDIYRDILEAKSLETRGQAVADPFCYVVYISDNFGVMIKGPNAGYLGMVTQAAQIVPFKLLEFIANMHRPQFMMEFYGGAVEAVGDKCPRWEVMRGYKEVLAAEFGDASKFVDYERFNAYRLARLTCNLQGCLQQIRRRKEFVASVGASEFARSQASVRKPETSVQKMSGDGTTEVWTTTRGSSTRPTSSDVLEDAASPPGGGGGLNFLRRNNVVPLMSVTDSSYSKDIELRALWWAAGAMLGVGVRPVEGCRLFLVAVDGGLDAGRADSIQIADAEGAGLYDVDQDRLIVHILPGVVLSLAPAPEGQCPAKLISKKSELFRGCH
jgi:hypothetical protein